MLCPNCGTRLATGQKDCHFCGYQQKQALHRWKQCVVNLEFGRSGLKPEDRRSGTAFLVFYKARYFLVTAAHLLIDKEVNSDKPINQRLFKQMFRASLLDELNDEKKRKLVTKNLFFDDKGQLHYQKTPKGIPLPHEGEDIAASRGIQLSESIEKIDSAVTISPDLDIAVISLRVRLGELFDKMFMNELSFGEALLRLGYQPITVEEIGDEPTQEGADLFTVGFPADVSHVHKREDIRGKYDEYYSIDVVLPCFTFGKVSMNYPELQYFWGDLRVYPGNSGSPIIEDGKLVGIVSKEAVIEYDGDFIRIPFAKATKAKFLPNLLDEQIRKDDSFADPKTLHKRFPNFFASPKELDDTKNTCKASRSPANSENPEVVYTKCCKK
jgi:hypothetical protein